MKLSILILLCVAGLFAQPAFVAGHSGTCGPLTGTSVTCVTAYSATAGNTLFVSISLKSEDLIPTVTDNLGSIYNFTGFKDNGNIARRVIGFSAIVAGAGGIVTLTFTSSQSETMLVAHEEISGAASATQVDVMVTEAGISATPSQAITTVHGNDYIVAVIAGRSATYTATGVANINSQLNNAGNDLAIAIGGVGETVAGAYTVSYSGSSYNEILLVAISDTAITASPFICRTPPGITSNWSTLGQWVYAVDGGGQSGCWGRSPADADFIRSVGSAVTIDVANWGATGTGRVRWEQINYSTPSGALVSRAALQLSCAFPQHLLTFASTGNNSIGAGSLATPGTSGTVTYHGFYIAAGTLNLSCPSGPQNYPASAQTGATGTAALTKGNPSTFTLTGGTMPSTTFGVLIRDSENCTVLNPSSGQNPRTGFFYATVTGANTFTVPIDSTACGAWDGQIVIPPIVVSSATGPGTQPTYIRSVSNDLSAGVSNIASVTVKNVLFPLCGVTGSTSVSACVYTNFSTTAGSNVHTLVLDNSTYLSGFGPAVISQSSPTFYAAHEIKNNWVNAMQGASGSSSGNTLFGTTMDNMTYSGNTVTNTTAASRLFTTALAPKGQTVTANAAFSSSTFGVAIFQGGNAANGTFTTSNVFNLNLCLGPTSNVNGTATGPGCIQPSAVATDTGTVMQNNVSEWFSAQSFYIGSSPGGNILDSGNWNADGQPGVWQGGNVTNNGVGQNYTGNVHQVIGTTAAGACSVFLMYDNAGANSYSFKNSVFSYRTDAPACVASSYDNMMVGETNFGLANPVLIDSNIMTGASGRGIYDQGSAGSTQTYATSCPAGNGVCRNLTFNNGTSYRTDGHSVNFTNGVNAHPNLAVYGDLDAVDPRFLSPLRTLETFDSEVLQGPGTYKHLAAEFSKRSGFGNCQICGTYTDGSYGAVGLTVIGAANAYLLRGSVSNEPRTWTAGVGGTDIGLQDAIVHRIPPLLLMQ